MLGVSLKDSKMWLEQTLAPPVRTSSTTVGSRSTFLLLFCCKRAILADGIDAKSHHGLAKVPICSNKDKSPWGFVVRKREPGGKSHKRVKENPSLRT